MPTYLEPKKSFCVPFNAEKAIPEKHIILTLILYFFKVFNSKTEFKNVRSSQIQTTYLLSLFIDKETPIDAGKENPSLSRPEAVISL